MLALTRHSPLVTSALPKIGLAERYIATTADVDIVDATYRMLTVKGVAFIHAPADQPWGIRSAYFSDHEGNLWEIRQPVAS
jgi:uncharacterized glyoxalase superfamily protein PhnB